MSGFVAVVAVVVLALLPVCAQADEEPARVPWVDTLPPAVLPPLPTLAPSEPGWCSGPRLLVNGKVADCTGMFDNPSSYQYLLDAEAALTAARKLLDTERKGRRADRAWADGNYTRLDGERIRAEAATRRARKRHPELFLAGVGVGGAVVAGVLAGVVVAVATAK